jgi:hypothetical protein
MPTPVGVNRVGLTRKANARIASYLTTALAFMVRLDGRCAVEQVRKAVGVKQVLRVVRTPRLTRPQEQVATRTHPQPSLAAE